MKAGFLIKGIVIGLLFGIPVGAVGTLTIQRAYHHGFAAGLKVCLYDKTIGFCKGCLACLKPHRCVIYDDADTIAQKMGKAV